MEVKMARPERWDVPFGQDMTADDVERLFRIEPFRSMDARRFSPSCSLEGILLNDTRIVRYQPGDIIVREGDYGNSAFLVLRGNVRATLTSLPPKTLGRGEPRRKNPAKLLAQLWNHRRPPEVRTYGDPQFDPTLGTRHRHNPNHEETTQMFLQDVPGLLQRYRTATIGPGEIFGEVACLARVPRSATIFSEGESALLEIRWQGLRDLMRRAPQLKEHLDTLYRQNNLESHLRATPLLQHLSPQQLQEVAQATEFETYGNFAWQAPFRQSQQQSLTERVESEPMIAAEGHYPNGLILIRAGFARLSRKYGEGHRTMAYLGKGQAYGFEELAHNWQAPNQIALQNSLRSLGYVDILRIPTHLMEQYVFSVMSPKRIRRISKSLGGAWIDSMTSPETTSPNKNDEPPNRSDHGTTQPIETGTLEFVLDHRLMNGTQAMIIDMDRCTRCDDCVRACASTHDNNPRFIRNGPRTGKHMIAHACMHCVDPVCMIGCPTGAIGRDSISGNVVINDITCIGCATCANSCPYQNINMVEIRDQAGSFILDSLTQQPIAKATKCDLCQDQWGGPACVRACPHDAMIRIDMNDLDSLSQFLGR